MIINNIINHASAAVRKSAIKFAVEKWIYYTSISDLLLLIESQQLMPMVMMALECHTKASGFTKQSHIDIKE